MSSDEQKVLERETTEEQYIAAVLEFLDQEIAADDPSKHQEKDHDDVDVLLSSVLKQAIGLTDLMESAEDAEPSSGALSHLSPGAVPMDTPDAQASGALLLPSEAEAEELDLEPVVATVAEHNNADSAALLSSYSSKPARGRRGLAVSVKAAAGLAVVLAGACFYWIVSGQNSSEGMADPRLAAESEGRVHPNAMPARATGERSDPVADSGAANNSAASMQTGAQTTSAPAISPTAKSLQAPGAARTAALPTAVTAENTSDGRNAAVGTREDSPTSSPVPVVSTSTAPLADPAPATIAADQAPASGGVGAADAVVNTPPPQPLPAPLPSPLGQLSPVGELNSALPGTAGRTQPAPTHSKVVPAEPISKAAPVYPEIARRNHITGTVIVDAEIDDQGRVTKATPVSGPASLQGAAVEAILRWRYKPASLNGVNISSRTRVSVVFKN